MPTRELGFSALMKALYTRLTTNSLTSSYRVYNYAQPNAVLPYVTFGAPIGVRSANFSCRDIAAEDNVVTIHVWSEYHGDKEAADMMNNIVQAIDSASLSITEYFPPFLAVLDYAELFVDDSVPTRLMRHGVLRWRFHMGPS